VAALAAAVTLVGAIYATQQHPADAVTLNAKGISGVSMAGSATAALLAYAKSLLLTETSGEVDVVLPIASSECGVLHDQAGLRCDSTGAQVATTISATWPATRELEVASAAGTQIDLAVAPGQDGGVSFSVTGSQPLRLCIGPAASSAPFTLRFGSSDVTFPVGAVPPICTGLVVAFRSQSAGMTSGFILQGIADMRVSFQGQRLTLSADVIRLTPHSTATDSTFAGGLMKIASDRRFSFAATGAPPDTVAKDREVDNATTVTEADVERLPNAFNHYTWISYLLTLGGAVLSLVFWRSGS